MLFFFSTIEIMWNETCIYSNWFIILIHFFSHLYNSMFECSLESVSELSFLLSFVLFSFVFSVFFFFFFRSEKHFLGTFNILLLNLHYTFYVLHNFFFISYTHFWFVIYDLLTLFILLWVFSLFNIHNQFPNLRWFFLFLQIF